MGHSSVPARRADAPGMALSQVERRDTSLVGRKRRTLFGLLQHVEQTEASGLLRLEHEGRLLGTFALAQGRIGYVTVAQDGAGSPANTTGIPFPDHSEIADRLVERGPAEIEELRSGLCWQAAHAALTMIDSCGGADPDIDIVAATNGWDERLTFSPAEMFLAACACLDDAPRDGAQRVYESLARQGEVALLLARGNDPRHRPFAVAGRGLENAAIPEVAALVRQTAARAARDGAHRTNPQPRCEVIRSGDQAWVAVVGTSRLGLIRMTGAVDAKETLDVAWSVLRREAAGAHSPSC